MNHVLTLPSPLTLLPAPRLRLALLLILSIALWLACAISLAPTLHHAALASGAAGKSKVCKCVHCCGGPNCCCCGAGNCKTK